VKRLPPDVYVVLDETGSGIRLTPLDEEGCAAGEPELISREEVPARVALWETGEQTSGQTHPRWVWTDTAQWYPALLEAGVRVERCVDLRLCHAILRHSELTASSALATAPRNAWDALEPQHAEPNGTEPARIASNGAEPRPQPAAGLTLFDLAAQSDPAPAAAGKDASLDAVAEFRLQREAVASSTDPNRINLLLAAESAGALVAAEMRFAGLPWSADVHDRILSGLLGPRPRPGERPAKLAALLQRIREALGALELNPDSPVELLKALNRAGLVVSSTRSWDLKRIDHPAIPPLLEYKKLARLLSANGWNWLDAWVRDGRFHPDYVVGGVVTGRWATNGGGALQLPKQIRGAVVADPGWKLVVADASQLEPRILAAMSGDERMAQAGRSTDMYAAIVASGAIATRAHAKVAMLGAMYGSTTGESGRLMPTLAKAYPKAIGLVEAAARAGERGEVVSTRLGRSSPRPGSAWQRVQSVAYGETATAADQRRARSQARSWGRFTRNFVVQGTAAEWALCWMAGLRRGLHELSGGAWLTQAPHLVFFLHDELVVHSPAGLAEEVAELVRGTATDAGRLIFGEAAVEFPLSVAVVDDYGQAK